MTKICFAMLLGLLAGSVLAAEDTIDYRINQRDTLIGIGKEMLDRPADWPQVQRVNKVRDPLRLKPGSVLKIPASLMKPDPVPARVESVAGAVSLLTGKTLSKGDEVPQGATVITGADGYVALSLPDQSRVLVRPGSRLRIDELLQRRGGTQSARLGVEAGRIENEVAPQKGPAARYEIRTPTAVIGVRGTRFRASYEVDTARSLLEVTEGSVAAAAGEAPAQAVSAGFGSVLAQGSATSPAALLAAPSLDEVPPLFERPLIRLPLPPMYAGQRWRLVVAAGQDFATPVYEGLEPTSEARVAGLPDGDYRFRLRGVADNGLEGMDAEGRFKLKARPEPPFPIAPQNAGKTREPRMPLTWTGQPAAKTYRLQIATDADFKVLVLQKDDIGETRFTAELPLGEYYWRLASVRADGDRGPWGDAQRFVMAAPQGPPEKPAMEDGKVSFAWPGEPGQSFEFEMASDPEFRNVVERRKVDVARLELPQPAAGLWHIRVRATDADGYVGQWSGTQQLEVPRDWRWLWLTPALLLLLTL
ncbi:FecR domain-containing protein [Viridibacterium curvum]|uniref:FecR domain-containing protein n=1 Tax=Viridibacterium curvum TaxID=1101404 RepID=A0ABP9QPK1_9RHOO